MKVSREAYAKINLFLSVGDKRSDGFHDILSVMHAVSLSDTVTLDIVRSSETEISLVTGGNVPDGPSNLAWRACEAFLAKAGIEGYSVGIRLEKRIPVAGGLAGGSTDAAATLVLLNGFFGEVLTFSELLDLGARIGSDVPFCILGGTVLARGRGEKLTPITPARKYHFLIANGGAPVSTAEAYRELDRRSEERGFDEKFPDPLIRSLKDGAPIDDYLFNSFEYVILPAHPEAARAHRVISDNGGTPLLSGSGPSVFGVFDDLSLRANAKKQLEEEDYLVFECESV